MPRKWIETKVYLSTILNACFVAETTLLHTLSGYDYYKVKIVDFLQKEMSFFVAQQDALFNV